MRYEGTKSIACQESLEDRIARLMVRVEADKSILDSIHAATDLYGTHYIRELKAESVYSMTALQYRSGKKELKGLLKEQKKQK